jgi:hypothetical protein
MEKSSGGAYLFKARLLILEGKEVSDVPSTHAGRGNVPYTHKLQYDIVRTLIQSSNSILLYPLTMRV